MIYIKNNKIRSFIIKLLNLIIKITDYLFTKNEKIKSKLISIRELFSLNLHDDIDFLSYVNKKREGLNMNINSIKTLALRGSTADYGFYAPLWKDSYNLGITSSDLYTNYKIYENFKNEFKVLENIVIFYSVFVQGYSLVETSERYRAVSYKFFFDVPYLDSNLIKFKFEKIVLDKCSSIKKINVKKEYNGYEFKTNYSINSDVERRTNIHLRENRREPNQLYWLQSLANSVNIDKRKLYVVIPPFRSDYKNLLPNQSILFEKLYELENINILNLYDSTNFSDYDFGDPDHLNEQGAIKLTKDIYESINTFNES